MPTLSELQYQAFSTNSGTTGTLNEVTYAYLAQVTGLSGISLQEQWAAALATNGFAVGTVNERQMAYWASLGYSGNWNERFYQWLSDGGAFGPNVLIQPQGTVPTVGYCDYAPAGSCTATRQYLAIDSGFTNPANQWVWSIEPPVTGVSVSAGQGTNTCTVSTTNLDVDTAFNLKVVATDTVSTDSAERTSAEIHYHREDLAVTDIVEDVAGSCDYDSGGGGESSCVSQATYSATITGTPDTYQWSLSNITGGTAVIVGSSTSATVVVQTSGGAPSVGYKLSLDLTSQFQTAQLSEDFTQTKTDLPTPVFVGPDIDTTQLVEDVLMTPFDVSGRFTGDTAGNYVLVGTWPTGVSIDANGVLSGTPAGPAADYTNLQFQAGNANGDTLSNLFTVQVIEGASLQPPVFIGPDLGGGVDANVPFNEDLRVRFSGDTATYTNTGNALPTGLTLDPSGVISGTPTVAGVYSGLQFTATNAAGSDTTNTFTFEVYEDIVFSGPIPDQTFVLDTPYSLDASTYFTGTVSGYSLGGSWPAGFSIDAAGLITGTATVTAAYTGLSVTATNSKPDSAVSNTFNGTAGVAPVFSGPIADQTWTIDELITPLDTSTYFGGATDATYSISAGALPTGLSIDPNTGIITGTPTVETTGTFTVTCTNALDTAASNSVGWTVQQAATGPAFWALTPDETTYEMLGVKTGTGDLTTTHTADLYALDSDNVWRKFGANEAVWSGGRLVRNHVARSNDFANWVPQSNVTLTPGQLGPTGGNDATRIAATANNGNIQQDWQPYVPAPNGEARSQTISCWMRRVSGTGGVFLGVASPSIPNGNMALIYPTAEWKRYTMTVSRSNNTGGYTKALIQFETSGDEIDVAYCNGDYIYGHEAHRTGSELVTNPTFGSATGWTLGTGWSISGGKLISVASSLTSAEQSISVTKGKQYVIKVVADSIDSGAAVSLIFGDFGGLNHYHSSTLKTITETYTFWYTWTAIETDNVTIELRSSTNATFDELSVYESDVGVPEYIENTTTNAFVEKEYGSSANVALNTDFSVDDTVGTPLAEVPYLQYYPAAQNDLPHSNTLSNFTDNPGVSRTSNQVGLTGEANTAVTVTRSSDLANYGTYFANLPVTWTTTCTIVLYIKATTSAATFPLIKQDWKSGGGINKNYCFNTDTGVLTVADGSVSVTATEVIRVGDWWKVMLQNDGASTSVTPSYAPAYNTDGSSTGNDAAYGSSILGNYEIHADKTIAQVRGLGPIFTVASAVATDFTLYEFDYANHADDKTAYYIKYGDYNLHEYPNGTITRGINVAASAAYNPLGFSQQTGVNYRSFTESPSGPRVIHDFYPTTWNNNAFSVVYDFAGSAEVGLRDKLGNATWTEATLNGVYTGDRLGITQVAGEIVSFQVHEFQRYDISSYNNGKTIIDGLMA